MKCERCKENHKGDYGSGRFCTVQCANSRGPRTKEFKEAVSKKLTKPPFKFICIGCGNEKTLKNKPTRDVKYCSKKCIALDPDYKEKMSIIGKSRFKTLESRIRMREIGRKGGFGKKGYTNGGIYYQSIIEKNCFEYLENNNIEFIPHKNIPNSSKISDVYLINIETWIEIDGINREKNKEWLGKHYNNWILKIKEYKDKNLKLEIIYNFKEFKKFIDLKYKMHL